MWRTVKKNIFRIFLLKNYHCFKSKCYNRSNKILSSCFLSIIQWIWIPNFINIDLLIFEEMCVKIRIFLTGLHTDIPSLKTFLLFFKKSVLVIPVKIVRNKCFELELFLFSNCYFSRKSKKFSITYFCCT